MIRRQRHVAVGVAAVVALASSACDRGPAPERTRYLCRCSFLTDYDDLAIQEVEVCAPTARVSEVARSCAQRAAPGQVERCDCTPSSRPSSCSADECAQGPG